MTDTPARTSPPTPDDYSAAAFEGKAVQLFELFKANLISTRQPLIAGKTFTNCVIEGPAVILALDNVVFDACNMGATPDGDARALLLMPMAKNRVVGAMGFKDCRFERCSFFAVGFTGPDSFIDQFLQVLDKPRDPVS